MTGGLEVGCRSSEGVADSSATVGIDARLEPGLDVELVTFPSSLLESYVPDLFLRDEDERTAKGSGSNVSPITRPLAAAAMAVPVPISCEYRVNKCLYDVIRSKRQKNWRGPQRTWSQTWDTGVVCLPYGL